MEEPGQVSWPADFYSMLINFKEVGLRSLAMDFTLSERLTHSVSYCRQQQLQRSRGANGTDFGVTEIQIPVMSLPFTMCVIMGKLFNHSELHNLIFILETLSFNLRLLWWINVKKHIGHTVQCLAQSKHLKNSSCQSYFCPMMFKRLVRAMERWEEHYYLFLETCP